MISGMFEDGRFKMKCNIQQYFFYILHTFASRGSNYQLNCLSKRRLFNHLSSSMYAAIFEKTPGYSPLIRDISLSVFSELLFAKNFVNFAKKMGCPNAHYRLLRSWPRVRFAGSRDGRYFTHIEVEWWDWQLSCWKGLMLTRTVILGVNILNFAIYF